MPCSAMSSSHSVTLISTSTVIPDESSTLGELKLSVSDLPMLSCHYIQKGCLFTRPPPGSLSTTQSLLSLLRDGLSRALTRFPPLAGRLTTDSDGYVYITCNDAGVDFIHATAPEVHIRDVISPIHVPEFLKGLFPLDMTVSYDGHFKPILSVQVTELNDGVFIGCAVNHAVTDGTSFWNFFNTFADSCRGVTRINRSPDFSRDSVLISPVALKFPDGAPKVSFDVDAPLAERIFSFTRESILNLKDRVNNRKSNENDADNNYSIDNMFEMISKESNDSMMLAGGGGKKGAEKTEISSFQSLCALLWRAVTRARKLPPAKTTTFRMAVNCRHRLEPKLDPNYFGNAIQSIPTYASACDVTTRDLRWCAEKLLENVTSHDDSTVRRFVEDWERDPRCFPLGNFDGAMLTMGSSPRFPMYENGFGWGRPMAVRSGRANKFDGKISAFPGREGGGSVDLEVVLAPETMTGLESDPEFMQYVSVY